MRLVRRLHIRGDVLIQADESRAGCKIINTSGSCDVDVDVDGSFLLEPCCEVFAELGRSKQSVLFAWL